MADPRYRALLIGGALYSRGSSLRPLKGPANDVEALRKALIDPRVGLFQPCAVRTVTEGTMQVVLDTLEDFFAAASKDDILLLYCSGHGLLDSRSQLFPCVREARTDRVKPSAGSNRQISDMIDSSAARATIIVLDCCHSGALKGTDLPDALQGNKRFILASRRSTGLVDGHGQATHTSLFTQHVIDGLLRGATDHDADGSVSLDELYDYVHRQIDALRPRRPVPQHNFSGGGDLAIARRPRPVVAPPPQPVLDRSATAPALVEPVEQRAGYDLFFSYTRADRTEALPIVDALRDRGLRVFLDEREIDGYEGITESIVTGLGQAKALVAYYSATYPTRPACRWELTAAYIAAEREVLPAQGTERPRWRVLVINPEESYGHIHPLRLRDMKHPADEELVDRIAGYVGGLHGTFGDVPPLAPLRWIPETRSSSNRFVGRFAEMWAVHSALHPEAAALTAGVKGPWVAQVRGLGGIGKSLLAEEYALRFGAAYPGGAFWLSANGSHDETDPGIGELEARRHGQLRQVAKALSVAVEDRDPEELRGLIAAKIEQDGRPCLWVVDDLPAGLDGQQARRWFAPHPLARTLVTTRSHSYGALGAVIDLDVLDKDDAYELLTARRRPAQESEQDAAHEIVEELGRHALAVDVAGGMCRAHDSYAPFREKLRSLREDELELGTDFARALLGGHERSVAATLMRSVTHLGDDGRDFLRVAAMLAPAPIPARLVAAVLREADGVYPREADRRVQGGAAQAESQSLARNVTDPVGAWLIHALVARTVRFRERETAPGRLADLRGAAVAVLAAELAQIEDARAHVELRDVVPHARELTRVVHGQPEIELLGLVARYDKERGQFGSAESLYQQVHEAYRRLFGEEHRDTLAAKGSVAATLYDQGNLTGARELQEQVLEACRHRFGRTDPDTLTAMGHLAKTRYAQGDLVGARKLQDQVLRACQHQHGSTDPRTLTAMGSLALTLCAQRDLALARDLQEQVLGTRLRLFDGDHLYVLVAKENLAKTLRAQGDLAHARDLQEQVLEARLHLFDDDHPHVLAAEENLAKTLYALDDLACARDLQEHVLKARRRPRDEDHPEG